MKKIENHCLWSPHIVIYVSLYRRTYLLPPIAYHRQHGSADLLYGRQLKSMGDPIFGPPQTENPLTNLDKICHQ